jgi:hypothetical protein
MIRRYGEWPAVLSIVFVAATAPAFLEDDAAFFNYLANTNSASPLFYYYGYVSFIATPIAYALSGLPFVVQAVVYRLVALAALLVFYRELRRFLAMRASDAEARWLAVATLLIARGVDIYIWGNLTYAIWPAFLAAALYVLRSGIERRRWSWWSTTGVLIAAMANPLGLLLVPLLIYFARDAGARRQQSIVAAAIALGHAIVYARSPDAVVMTTNPLEIVALFVGGYRTEFKLNTAVVVLSLLAIAIILVRDLRSGDKDDGAERVVRWSLAFLGAGSVAAYVLSDRFPLLEGGFRSQHALPVLFAALVMIARTILRHDDQWRRGLLLGMFLGVAALTVSRELYFHLRGPAELALMKYRFLMDASTFRRSCQPGEGMVFEDASSSPIVLCRPQDLGIGRHSVLEYPPAVGERGDDDEDPRERPGIMVGKPLF